VNKYLLGVDDYVRMDDDLCVFKYIEIVPVDDSRNCYESSDVKLSPCCIKVCMLFDNLLVHSYILCLCVVKFDILALQ